MEAEWPSMNPGNVSKERALGMLIPDVSNTLRSCVSEAGNSEATFYTRVCLLVKNNYSALILPLEAGMSGL